MKYFYLVVGLLCLVVSTGNTGELISLAPLDQQSDDARTQMIALASKTGDAEPVEAAVRPHAGMLRYADVSASSIVFVYANDLWLVSRQGGMATPLASPAGEEMFPRFSPDGKSIAFVGNYDGDRDIYIIAVEGGIPFRVTHHPANEMLCDWTPQNELLFYASGLAGLGRQSQLFTVSPECGMPHKLPVPYGANGAINGDGEWLAYTPHSRDFRTWKRYRGGMATDIWLFNLKDYKSKKITDFEGTDTYPMWYGNVVYYLSDAGPNHRLNIWSYNTTTEKREQVTTFKDFDCKFPSIGPGANGEGEIVFQNGSNLYLLNLSTGQSKSIIVMIPGARPEIRSKRTDVSGHLRGWGVSSTGKRVVIAARGDIWTLPEKKGAVRNLTRSSGAAERYPSWSPDGRWIAYFSDESGEYELYIMQSDGKEETQQLTSGGKKYRYNPTWSPDSKNIAFTDNSGSIYIHNIDNKESLFVDKDRWGSNPGINWSHDSAWIAYVKGARNQLNSIFLYNLKKEESYQVTSDMFNDTAPTFDRKGDFLFFASNRNFDSPIYEDAGWGLGKSFVYSDTDLLYAVPLRADVKDPYLFESDEESWEDEKDKDKEGKDEEDKDKDSDDDSDDDKDGSKDDGDKKAKDKKKKDDDVDDKDAKDQKDKDGDKDADKEAVKDKKDNKKKEDEKPLEIDIEGFERRAFQLSVKHGNFYALSVNHEDKLIYCRSGLRNSGGKTSIKLFDLSDEKKEEKTVLDDMGGYDMTADGKKMLVRKGSSFHVIKAEPDQKLEDAISAAGLRTMINPREEWREIFTDAWRRYRDFFYDPNMHGVDWEAVRKHYEGMLDDCATREDLSFVIKEMISELNVGHAYYGGGDVEGQPSESVGMLGVDLELKEGAYCISKIYEGAVWDVDARSPFNHVAKDKVDEGDYILAVNGVPIDANLDPWAAFIGLADKTVVLTVGDEPVKNDDSRDVVIKLLSNDGNLRYRAWIEKNRAYVDKKSGGKVGYIYVPNTGVDGQNNLFRQFYGQMTKEALIIDERWNGGGQAPSRFIELLKRPITNYWALRDGDSIPWPTSAHHGPKCMLINGLAGSGGDMFPALFRQAELGKLVGMRTWGGLVGISGMPPLVDGGRVSVPNFAYFDVDGTWGIEGHGVDPDIEIVDNPSKMINGGDPQLDAAIDLMIEEINSNPYIPARRPKYPDRSGMGILEEDK